MKEYTQEELDSGKEIYEALLDMLPEGSKGNPLYFTDGIYVFPDGRMEEMQRVIKSVVDFGKVATTFF